MRTDLERLFNPSSIAVIGASAELGTISGQPLNFLVKRGYAGALYPINPKYEELLGHRCYGAIEALPEVPDLALITVNARLAVRMLEACGRMGVPFVVMFSSGFSEVGEAGASMQAELAEIARRYDIGLVGPNCQGLISVPTKTYAGFGSAFIYDYLPGPVSMVSQSGGFGFSVVSLAAMEGGVRFRHIVTTGNEVGITTLDFMRFMIDDPGTTMVAAYTEGMKDALRLREIGEAALAARKPIVIWKVGNSEEGQRAVASHTANLGGAMTLYRAAFEQTGILQIEDIQDIVDYYHAFQCGKAPRGNRVAIITISGGAGILMTDEAIAHGLAVEPVSPETVAQLRPLVPAFAALGNPIDLTAAIFDDTDLCRKALELIIEDPRVDSVVMANAGLQGEIATKVAREIAAAARRSDKPIMLGWSARHQVAGEAYALLDEVNVPHYRSPMRCVRALAALTRHATACRRYDALKREPLLALHSAEAHSELGRARTDLSEHRAKKLLARYAIPVTAEELAASAGEAVRIAERLGFPVVMKVQSHDIPHKTEAGGVRVGLRDAAEVEAAFDAIIASARAYQPDAVIDGVLVQEMVVDAVEVIVGVKNDPLFGPALMFGLGGIFTEVMKDVAFRLAPIQASVATEMIREVRGYALLAGARGRPVCDEAALCETLCKVSALAVDLRDHLAELDINPLFVLPAGRGVKAGDALIKPLPMHALHG
ncbi:MAG: CoA-binding protein [Betaproteobacteria bacterium]|nr:MAG: CoA-binding protein [Betaproteobacteria bacterium]